MKSMICAVTVLVLSISVFAGWEQHYPMSAARDSFAGAVIGEDIFVFGGNDPDGHNLDSGEKYSIKNNTWTSIASNPHYESPWGVGLGVEEVSGVVVDGKFYVFGAYGGFEDPVDGYYGNFNFNEMYDPATDSWTTLAKKPTTTSTVVPAVYKGEIYLFGGYSGDDPGGYGVNYTVVEAYNPATDTWRYVTDMPKGIMNQAVAVYEDVAYIIGGYDYNAGEMNTEVMVYHFETNTWTRNYCTAPPEAARAFAYGAQTVVRDGKVYLVGGIEGTLENHWSSDRFTIFDIAAKTWASGPALPQARAGHLTAISNHTLYVIGGGEEMFDDARDTVFTYSLIGSPDLNDSGTVDIGDLVLLAEKWLRTDCAAPLWCQGADIDRDGVVNFKDFVILAEFWLAESSGPVPDADYSGDYEVDLPDFYGYFTIQQDGYNANIYMGQDGPYAGIVDGNVMNITLNDDNNVGTMQLVFSSEGDSFVGTYDIEGAGVGGFNGWLSDGISGITVYTQQGNVYEVWASNSSLSTSLNYTNVHTIEGHILLGSASETQTFLGLYQTYVVVTETKVFIDAIKRPAGNHLTSSFRSSNLSPYNAVIGQPDEIFGKLGLEPGYWSGGKYSGFLAFQDF